VLSFLVMYFKADALAGLMNDDKAAAGIRALAPGGRGGGGVCPPPRLSPINLVQIKQ